MPRKSAGGITSALQQIQNRARSVLGDLRKQIREQEGSLARLKTEEANLSRLVGGMPSSPIARATAAGPRTGGRINWRSVLKQVPKQFKAADVRAVRGLKGKRPSEIFAAITRWIDSGLAKRKARGLYERV